MSFAQRLYLLLLIAIAGLTGLAIFGNREINRVYQAANEIDVNTVQSLKLINGERSWNRATHWISMIYPIPG